MKIVLTCGTFDILHPGHLHVFEKAKEYGDKLIVVLSRDATVLEVKGSLPYYNEEERIRMLESIHSIDEVRLGSLNDPYAIIEHIRPDVIALGYDQLVFVDKLAKKITEFGLSTQIVRLSPFREDRYKSKKIKQAIGLYDFIGDEKVKKV